MLQISAHPSSEHKVMCTAHGAYFARLRYYQSQLPLDVNIHIVILLCELRKTSLWKGLPLTINSSAVCRKL